MKNLYFIILVIAAFFSGCEKTEEFSDIPQIKFKEFNFASELVNDFENQVAYLTFEFVDGNGDLGFAENSDSIAGLEIPDIFVYKYKKIEGKFRITDTANYLLPYFAEGVYRKYIRGEMEIKSYLINQVNDTIRYDFQVMDRAYHLSNIESTPELIVPKWN